MNELKSVSHIDPQLFLPTANPFVPTDLAIKLPPLEEASVPHLVKSTAGTRLWHKQDITFKVPRSSVRLNLFSPLLNFSPVHAVMSTLMIELLEDSLNELSYYALMAGLAFETTHTPTKILVRYF
jgi:insulysin